MKISLVESKFHPISIVIESAEEARVFQKAVRLMVAQQTTEVETAVCNRTNIALTELIDD